MKREDARNLTLSTLVAVVTILAVDCICLHMKCARQTSELVALSVRLEQHINPPEPPAEPSLAEKAKQTYNKVKSAAAAGYQAVKEELDK